MLNVRPPSRGLTPQAWGTLSNPVIRRLARPGRLHLGERDVDPVYLSPRRVEARSAELIGSGYLPHLAALAVRLEGRENTLLDRTDGAGLDEREEGELRAVQALLATLDDGHRRRGPAAPLAGDVAEVEAIDTSTGALALFSVRHVAGAVRDVAYPFGGTCAPGGSSSPRWPRRSPSTASAPRWGRRRDPPAPLGLRLERPATVGRPRPPGLRPVRRCHGCPRRSVRRRHALVP